MLNAALIKAFDYVSDKTAVTNDIWMGAASAGVFKAAGDIAEINAKYHDAISQSLVDYLEGGSVTGPRNRFKKAMVEAFGSAFDTGYVDGGAELPAEADALEWYNARVEQELAYIDQLFAQAKELRKDKEADTFAWVNMRADGYTASVSSVYNAGKMYAQKNQLLLWRFGDADHCATCEKLNGQKHKASWYLSRDYIPGKPGAAMDCGGYRCKCALLDRNGNTVTI
jgi:hypothetical protein